MDREPPLSDESFDGNSYTGLAAATVGFFAGFAGVALIGPVSTQFSSAMGLSGLLVGLLVAAPQLAGSLLRIPFGAWVDRAGGKKPFTILLGLSLVGMAGLIGVLVLYYPDGLTRELYPVVFVFAALSGCGVATFSVGTTQVSYWFPEDRQGFAQAVYAGLGNSSPGISTLVLPVALVALGLTGAYVAWFALLLVGTVAYVLTASDAYYFQLRERGASEEEARARAREEGQELFPEGDAVAGLKTAAATGATWLLAALYFTSFGGFLALTTWLPTYWSAFHGFDARTAGVLTAVAFVLLATFIRIPGGDLSDRFGGEVTAIASYAVVLCGAALLALADSVLLSVLATVLLAVGMGVANAAVFGMIPEYVSEAVGSASGLVGGLGAFGGFVVPPVLGVFVGTFGMAGYTYGFVTYVALAAVAIGATLGLARRGDRPVLRGVSASD